MAEFAPSTFTFKENENPVSNAIPHAPTNEKNVTDATTDLLKVEGKNKELTSLRDNEISSSQKQADVRPECASSHLIL